MVKLLEVAQPFNKAFTVMVAVMVVLPALAAIKALMLPEPLAGKPMPVLLLVQPMVAPGVVVVSANAPVFSPAQNEAEAGMARLGGLPTPKFCEAELAPHSLLTERAMVWAPVEKVIQEGVAFCEAPAAPPSNSQLYVSGSAPQLVTLAVGQMVACVQPLATGGNVRVGFCFTETVFCTTALPHDPVTASLIV